MSAADSELSRCPDLATASIRTQSIRSTVAQRSSSAIEGAASRCGAFGGGLDLPAGEPVQPSGEPDSEPEPGDSAAPGSADEREVARVVRRYIDAIDARDGAAVCASLAPGAIEDFELPRGGAGCAASMRASIGYRDPRGFPVF